MARTTKKTAGACVKKAPVKKTKPAEEPLDPVFLTKFDRYLFGNGTDYKIYQKLGAHAAVHKGKKGMHFAVWAPHRLRQKPVESQIQLHASAGKERNI